MNVLETIPVRSLDEAVSQESIKSAVRALESGKVVFLPFLKFSLLPGESRFLNPSILEPKTKNISYDRYRHEIKGTSCRETDSDQLKEMMKRYALFSSDVLARFFPSYPLGAKQARTSFRPAEAAGRAASSRKDDRLLHVDSFPANPVGGNRILRVFTNVNPQGRARVWCVGEPFKDVIDKMSGRIKSPFPGLSYLLNMVRITKGYRTLYDHSMLQIHDAMKLDSDYQNKVPRQEVQFPAGSTWIVYTDQVSHAVISGQYVFEQTFYLPPSAMVDETKSPLRILEEKLGRPLI